MSPKISPGLAAMLNSPSAAGGTVKVIVQFQPQSGGGSSSSRPPPGGGLEFLDALATTVALRSIPSFAQDSRLTYISLDRPIGANLEFATPAVNATAVHSLSFRGAGVAIAVIDSRLRRVEDLRNGACTACRIVYNQNFVPGETTTNDLYGHGTHVAGIIAANGKCSASKATLRSRVFLDVAPEANILLLRALNAQGAGTDSSVLRAIGRAIQLRRTYNLRVINLSLGRKPMESCQLDPLGRAVAAAWQRGIFVAVAAANRGRDNSRGTNGYGAIGSPGNHPLVLTVGAVRDMGTVSRADDLMASYSSKGPTAGDRIVKPDLVAPGSTLANTFSSQIALRSSYLPQSTFTPGSYLNLSGTSMATPMAPGAAALYIQKWGPGTTPDAVKAALRQSAAKSFPRTSTCIDPQTGQARTIQYHLLTVGAGFLDARASLNKLPRTRSWVGLSPPASPTTVPREHEIVSSSPTSRAPCSATPANCPTAPSGAPPSSGAIASCGVTASCGAATPDSSPCPPSAEKGIRPGPRIAFPLPPKKDLPPHQSLTAPLPRLRTLPRHTLDSKREPLCFPLTQGESSMLTTGAETNPPASTIIERNRKNAQNSTGPKSIVGKAVSSQNRLAHGLCAKSLLIAGESEADFDQLRQTVTEAYQPVSAEERLLTGQLAQALWRYNRAQRIEAMFLLHGQAETGIYLAAQGHENPDFDQLSLPQGDCRVLGVFLRETDAREYDRIQRYLTTAERSYQRAVKLLEHAQEKRRHLPPPAEPAPVPAAAPVKVAAAAASGFESQNDCNAAPPATPKPRLNPTAARSTTPDAE